MSIVINTEGQNKDNYVGIIETTKQGANMEKEYTNYHAFDMWLTFISIDKFSDVMQKTLAYSYDAFFMEK